MKNLLKPVAVFSGIMLSAVSGVGAAQAGVLTVPNPDSTAAFSPALKVGLASGVKVKFLKASTCPVSNFAGLCNGSGGLHDGAKAPEVTTFDFLPPSGAGYGNFKVDNFQGKTFTNATGGRIKDFVLPYFGQGDLLNLSAAVNITALLDFDPLNGDAIEDTFDATTLTSVIFKTTSTTRGGSAIANFSFEGVYHINGQTYDGTVSLSQPISGLTAAGVVTKGRSANGFTTSYSGQTNVVVPEPLTMLGAGAALGFGSFFKRKVSKTKKGNKAA